MNYPPEFHEAELHVSECVNKKDDQLLSRPHLVLTIQVVLPKVITSAVTTESILSLVESRWILLYILDKKQFSRQHTVKLLLNAHGVYQNNCLLSGRRRLFNTGVYWNTASNPSPPAPAGYLRPVLFIIVTTRSTRLGPNRTFTAGIFGISWFWNWRRGGVMWSLLTSWLGGGGKSPGFGSTPPQ